VAGRWVRMSDQLIAALVVGGVVVLFLILAVALCTDPVRCLSCATAVRRRDLTDHLLHHCVLNVQGDKR
jgi:hypothetical protein